eukprot:4932299-Alexandrium_andersonii.AAC.1
MDDLCERREVAEVVAELGEPAVDGEQPGLHSQLVLVEVARALDADADRLVAELSQHDAAEPVLYISRLVNV